MISDDNVQRLQSWVAILTNGYKVLMASMLALFVPQKCAESPTNECSMSDNFTDLIPYNVVVLVFNFVTLALFLVFYAIEYNRENWCIEYLDYDENKPVTFLKAEIEHFPTFKQQLLDINWIYYRFTQALIVWNIVNVVMSAVLIYHFYYLDFKSITVMVTYVILIADKLAFTLQTSRRSYEECVPNSAYRTGPVVYNTIDSDYRTTMTNSVRTETEMTPPSVVESNKA